MKLLIITAILAVSEGARLEKRFLNTFQPKRTGGLFSPFGSIGVDSPTVPAGGYANDDLGIVVDAVAPGTRASGVEATGLGGSRASYGSLNSKVGDAAFKVGGSGVKGAAGGISSLFGTNPKTTVGLPGIGVSPGSSSLDVSGISADGASGIKGIGVKKTTYESINVPDAEGNAAIKGGATGLGSLFGSGASQGNFGLSGFGATPESSLDVSGIKGSDATGVKSIGVIKTTYKTIDTETGDKALKSSASAEASVSGFGKGQGNIGLPRVGAVSSSIDESGLKTNDVSRVNGIAITKTTYEMIDTEAGSASLGVGNTAVKDNAIGAASLSGSGNGQGNIGLAGIGAASQSSSLDISGVKTNEESGIKGVSVTETRFGSIDSFDGDAGLGIANVAAKGRPSAFSLFGSGESKEKIGITNNGFVPASGNLEASSIKTTGSGITGLDVKKKITYESIDIKGGENQKASIDVGPSTDLEVPKIAAATPMSLASYESVEIEKEDASIRGGAVGVGALFGSSIDQKTNSGLSGSNIVAGGSSASIESQGSHTSFPSVEVAKGSSSLEGSEVKITQHTGVGTVTKEISSPEIENDKIHAQNFAHGLGINAEGSASGGASVLEYDTTPKTNAALLGYALSSSSVDDSGIKTSGKPFTGVGVSKITHDSLNSKDNEANIEVPSFGVSSISSSARVEGQGNDKIYAQKFASNLAHNANRESELTTVNADAGAQKVVPCSCSVSSELKTSGAEHSGLGDKKTSESSVGSNLAQPETVGVSTSFGSSIKQEHNAGLPSITVVPGIDSSVATIGYVDDKLHAHKFVDELKKENKGVSSGVVNVGTYDVEYNHKIAGSSYSGEKQSSSGITTAGPNLVDQDLSSTGIESVPLQGPHENVQSWSSVGKVSITSGLQTTSTQEVNQDAVYHKTLNFGVHPSNEKSNVVSNQSSGSTSSAGVPNVNLQPDTSNGNSAYSEAFVGPNNGNLFNTGKLELVGQKTQDSNFDSFVLTSPSYYGNKVVDSLQKLTDHQGFKLSSTDSSSKVNTANNVQETHLPNLFNLYSNKPNILTQSGHYQGFSSSHYNDLNQASISTFPSPTTFGHLPSNLGTYESHENLFNQKQQDQLSQNFNVKDNPQTIFQKENYKPDQVLTGIYGNLQKYHNDPFTQNNYNDVVNGHTSSTLHQSQSNSQYSQSAQSAGLISGTGYLSMISELPHAGFQAVDTLFSQTPGYTITSSPDKKISSSSETYLGSTISGSQFGHKPLNSGIYSQKTENKYLLHTSTKPVETFQIGSTDGSKQFGSAFNSVNSEKSQNTQSSYLSHTNQAVQYGVKPFDSSHDAGSIASQTGSNDTFGTFEKGTISTISTVVKPFSQPEGTVTNPQSSDVVGPDPTIISEISSGNKKYQVGSLSSSLQSEKLDTYKGGFKEQSMQTGQIDDIPFDLQQNMGMSFSQTQFDNQLGSQSSLNTQKDVTTVVTSSEVEPILQHGVKLPEVKLQHSTTTNESNYAQKPVVVSQVGSENKSIHFDYSSVSVQTENMQSAENSSLSFSDTSKVQAGQTNKLNNKPFVISHGDQNSQIDVLPVSELIATVQSSKQEHQKATDLQSSQIKIEHTHYGSTPAPEFGKVPESIVSTPHQINTLKEKTEKNSSSSSLKSEKSEISQSISFSPKEQSVQTSQIDVKPIVLSHSAGFTSSQAQLDSTHGIHNSRPIGSGSIVATQVKPISQYVNKPSGSYFSHQSQDSSKSGYIFGKEPSELSQKEQFQFVSSSSVLSSNKSDIVYSGIEGTSQYNGVSNESTVDNSFTFIPVELSHSTDSKFTQHQFGTVLNSQKGGGSSNTQVKPISQFSSNTSGTSNVILNKHLQYSAVNESKFGATPTITTYTISGKGKENSQLDSSSTLTQNENSETVHGSLTDSSMSNDQSGIKPIETSKLGINIGSNSQSGVGTVLASFSSDEDKRTTGLHSSQMLLEQSQYSSTSESHIKNTSETPFNSHTFNSFGQKPTILSEIGYEKGNSQIGSSLSLLNIEKSKSGESNPSSYSVAYKEQSVQTNQFGIKPSSTSQATGSNFSQTQFGSKDENQNGLTDLNRKIIGTAQVSSVKSSEQDSKYNGNEKTHLNSSSIYVKDISVTSVDQKSHSSATSHLSLNEKPFVSSDKTASSQDLSSSITGYVSDTSSEKAEKPIFNSTTTNTQVQHISLYREKPSVSQANQFAIHQSQFTSTIGSEVGSDLQSKGSPYNLSIRNGQESIGTLQTGTTNEKNYVGSTSSSLGDKSQNIQSHYFSVSSSPIVPEKEIVEFGLKPFEFAHKAGSSISQTPFSEKFGFEYASKPFDLQVPQSYQQGTDLDLLTGSDGLFGLTHSIEPFTDSKITGSGFIYPQSSLSLIDNSDKNSQSTFSTTFSQVSQSPGYLVKTPVDSVQSPFQNLFGVAAGQSYASSASASASSSSFHKTQNSQVSKYQSTPYEIKGLHPFGGSRTQSVQKQTKVFGGSAPSEKYSELSSFVGKGEVFGGPRDPPSFDIKTGYSY